MSKSTRFTILAFFFIIFVYNVNVSKCTSIQRGQELIGFHFRNDNNTKQSRISLPWTFGHCDRQQILDAIDGFIKSRLSECRQLLSTDDTLKLYEAIREEVNQGLPQQCTDPKTVQELNYCVTSVRSLIKTLPDRLKLPTDSYAAAQKCIVKIADEELGDFIVFLLQCLSVKTF